MDADGSSCSRRPARLVHLFESIQLGGKAHVVGAGETVFESGSVWSLVCTLNNRGNNTCGRPFRWVRHLLSWQFSSTLNRLMIGQQSSYQL